MTKTKRILICDDEEGVRESLKLILEKDYDFTTAANGRECLDTLAKDDDIGLVLLDIKMPQMSGLDTLKAIKKDRPDLKVIMVTGYNSVETAAEAVKNGATGYIVKPFETKDILEKVAKNLG